MVEFELFRPELDAALERSDRARGGRLPYDAVVMFKVLVLQTLYTLSDDQTEYQLKDRLSFMRFVGLMDTEGRWTLKRGRKRAAGRSEPHERAQTELVIPVFGYKNHLGIDRRHGFIRRFVVTDAARHDGRQLSQLLDPHNTASAVWADSAYRSTANVAQLARRGLVPHFQRPKPRGKPIPPHIMRGNASRARVRVAIEHVFAAQKCRLGLVIRSVGLARATARLGLANLVTNMTRLAWFAPRPAPA